MQLVSSDCLRLNKFYKEHKDKARAKASDVIFAAIGSGSSPETTYAALRLLPYANFLFLRSVFTHPHYRGQGIAAQLIHHATNTIFKQSPELAIYTLPTPKALSLYQRLGFKPVTAVNIPAELQLSLIHI